MIVCLGRVWLPALARYATAYARPAIACVILTAAIVSFSAGAARADDPARQLYDAAGLQTWLQQVPAGLADAFQNAPHIDPELKPAIRALIERHFPLADLRQNALDGLTAAMSEDQMQAVTTFLDEPLGQRATEMEVAAQQPGLADMVMHEGTRIWRDLDDRGAECRDLPAHRSIDARGRVGRYLWHEHKLRLAVGDDGRPRISTGHD